LGITDTHILMGETSHLHLRVVSKKSQN